MHQEFFRFQRRALGVLLGWGLGSSVSGALLSQSPAPAVRHFGLQALSWGALDALLALAGRRDAARKLAKPAGTIDVVGETRRFRAILAMNAVLDIGYIAAGLYLRRSAGERAWRRGMGLGIIVQGLFLLIFDSLLALIIHASTPSIRKI